LSLGLRRAKNHSSAPMRAALSLTPWIAKTGMSAAVAPEFQSRARCQSV
jgi:hypothetical protein